VREWTIASVWYTSYGSNLSQARFACYLTGGTFPGSTSVLPGARDASPPAESMPFDVPYRLYFAGHTRSWGGAPAFIGTTPDPLHTLGRAYLIGWDQFEDVVAQENGRQTASIDWIQLGDLAAGEALTLGPGWYDHLICLGHHQGVPVVTFTAPEPITPTAAPSRGYLATIIEGLRQTYGLSQDEIVAYLAARGCDGDTVAAIC